MRRINIITIVSIFCITLLTMATTASAVELVRTTKKDGSKSNIYVKLITRETVPIFTGAPNDQSNAKFIVALNIFFQAKTDDGKLEKDGCYRVASKDGTPLGWVKKKDVVTWNTRYSIKPFESDPSRGAFEWEIDPGQTLNRDGEKSDEATTATYDPPDGQMQFAYILGRTAAADEDVANSDGPFEIIMATALNSGTGSAQALNRILTMDLEIVFVIEATDFMLAEYAGTENKLYDYVKTMGKSFGGKISKLKGQGGKSPVRLGLVAYEDANTLATRTTPKVIQKLTNNYDQWLSALDNLELNKIQGDWEEDGISGLNTAIEEAGWKDNSTKHIVLIAQGSFQPHPKGTKWKSPPDHFLGYKWDRGHPLYSEAGWNPLPDILKEPWQTDFDEMFGYNTCGLTIEEIKKKARSAGNLNSADQQIRAAKMIHAFWFGKDLNARLQDSEFAQELKLTIDSCIEGNKRIRKLQEQKGISDDQMFSSWIRNKVENMPKYNPDYDLEKLKDAIKIEIGYNVEFQKTQQDIAQKTYQDLANNGEFVGMFQAIPPDSKKAMNAAKALRDNIEETIDELKDIGDGEEVAVSESNQMVRPLQMLKNKAGKVIKGVEAPTLTGTAYLLSEETGRSVGSKAILVSKDDLEKLYRTFKVTHEKFSEIGEERDDVKKLLEELKTSILIAVTGQNIEINAQENLQELITNLPLRTNALDINAGQLANMNPAVFQRWLAQLETAQKNTQLLIDNAKWRRINSVDDTKDTTTLFCYLDLTDMP